MKYCYVYKTPIGSVKITQEREYIREVSFSEKIMSEEEEVETQLVKQTYQQLMEYFTGNRKNFDIPILIEGTAFRKKVWEALQEVPYGECRSYKQIAQRIGNEKACRAVGMANNKNPIAILVPCHRIIGSNKKLIGYAGGIEVKKYLLDLEKKYSK